MPSAETTLAEDIAPGKQVALEAPGVRYGKMEPNSGAVTVDGEAQPFAIMAVDLLAETIHVTNGGPEVWAAGATLVVTWEGTLAEGPPVGSPPGTDPALEAQVADHEVRLDALEASAGGGGGASGDYVPISGGTMTGPLVLKGSDADSFAIEIDTANPADGCSIRGKTAGEPRWEISLGDPTADANFAISRYPTWGSDFPLDSPLVIYRATGFIKLILTERADSEAAGQAGVPIGGLYSTNGTVRIRTY